MKNKKKADLILVLCLLLFSCILFYVRTVTRQDGSVAAIYVDGVRKAEYPLSEDRTINITFDANGAVSALVETSYADYDCVLKTIVDSKNESAINNDQSAFNDYGIFGFNVLEIHDGFALVAEADCPDKICVESHKIRYNGESITCLPHRLQIVIEGGEGGVDL